MMRLRAQVFRSVKFNFQSDVQFASQNWQCECGQIQSQQYLLVCNLLANLRSQHSIEDDAGIVDYFDEILRRTEKEE